MSIGFELWFVDGCFIADEYFFVGECFCGLSSEGWGSRFGLAVLAEDVLTRARMRALVLGVLFFLLSQVSQRMELRILHQTKNDVSFYGKWRVVLLKTTYRFTENNISFYRKQRVVLLKTTCCFVESDGLFLIGGRKVVLRMVFWGFWGVE